MAKVSFLRALIAAKKCLTRHIQFSKKPYVAKLTLVFSNLLKSMKGKHSGLNSLIILKLFQVFLLLHTVPVLVDNVISSRHKRKLFLFFFVNKIKTKQKFDFSTVHNMFQIGRGGCKSGVCKEYVDSEDMTIEFPHLGIQCVRKKDVEASLRERRGIRVDPYRQGFRHMENTGTIDLNAVKLCFQVCIYNFRYLLYTFF